ncbi:hypothetical protein B7494_g1463 [Chlorociboria aeruginascens]|nr:hypothetical protein B7494_g1463 [Chlorociboria aeruginascens]
MDGAIEALYIYDEHNKPLLTHTYTSRPLTASQLLPLYLEHPVPRPNLIYLPNTSPPTLLFNLTHSNLLFFITSSSEIEPLLALEFLHRVIDILEEFVGTPLLAQKIEGNYEIVAQLLNEMCDAGSVSTTEPNALRDLVEVEGFLGKLLGGINIPGKPGFTSNSSTSGMSGISSAGTLTANTPALPWRRANVRHTSNELYVDLVETLSVTLAPSGRPLAAFANGTIAFTSKVSGVPDIILNLSTRSGQQNFNHVMELPVFHPCVRLARWREKPGEISFIPPDGRFVLAGYEVDLLPFTNGKSGTNASNLKLPVNIEVKTSLGLTGSDFEVRLFIMKVSGQGNSSLSGSSSRSSSQVGGLGRASSGFSGGLGGSGGNSTTPILEDLVVTIPLPGDVRNLSEIKASRGDTTYNPGEKNLEWHLPAKDASTGGATLRCTVVGPLSDDNFDGNGFRLDGYYEEDTYQLAPVKAIKTMDGTDEQKDLKKVALNKILMPSSANVSFAVKGWLASGIKVDSIIIDTRKSRGLGDGVKPYRGVKYLTLSRGGVEIRC